MTAGYIVNLYKFMRIDENENKRDALLLESKKENREVSGIKDSDGKIHTKFLAFGEFDQISFDRVTRFDRYRDVSEQAKYWVGDRQVHLIFDINGERDGIYYKDHNFYERGLNESSELSERLFIGMTILQMKNSQKMACDNMNEYLCKCKENILKLVKNSQKDVKCAVFGTLGSFGITVIWLADQYQDVLELVSRIRNTRIGYKYDEQGSIFLSSYTIFARNHDHGSDWSKRIEKIRGEAIVHLTLKCSINEKIKKSLEKWKAKDTHSKSFHCAGEYDVVFEMDAYKAYNIFYDENLKHDADFYKEYVLQSNVQYCEPIIDSVDDFQMSQNKGTTKDESQSKGKGIDEFPEILNKYKELRKKFVEDYKFSSDTGLVDTLDLLYGDYISKISTASNEMWVDDFSHQYYSILECIKESCYKLYISNEIYKEEVLEIINHLLGYFERQISHIAESNNLVLGTPVCQFRYSGQNNLTLYAYFGIIKNFLNYIYCQQGVSVQDELVPLIVADVVPEIRSTLFVEWCSSDKTQTAWEHGRSKIIALSLPMVALYNPVVYYPYLYHEIAHYTVPMDRHVRNVYLGSAMTIRLLLSILETICLESNPEVRKEGSEQVNLFFEDYVLKYVYSFVITNYEKYLGNKIEQLDGNHLKFEDVNNRSYSSSMYENMLIRQWIEWLSADEYEIINKNMLYLCLIFLNENQKNIEDDFDRFKNHLAKWEKAEMSEEKLDVFFRKINGIVNNDNVDIALENFHAVISGMNIKQVMDDTCYLAQAIKEGLADTNMVAVCSMELEEYLLLYTKIKKDLQFSPDAIGDEELQDVIRIGIITDYIFDKMEGNYYEELIEQKREKYVALYCGMYYGRYNELDVLYQEANSWFNYWGECYSKYSKEYRLYAGIFYGMQKNMILFTGGQAENEKLKKDNGCWKEYIALLENFGEVITVHLNETEDNYQEQIERERMNIDKQRFDINLKLICEFQNQDSLSSLNKKRKDRIEKQKNKDYDLKLHLEDIAIQNIQEKPEMKEKKEILWEYHVDSVESLCRMIANIAKELQEDCVTVFGKKYPIWYRGHVSEEYKLVPSIMRDYKREKRRIKDKTNFTLLSFLKSRFEEFKFRADEIIEPTERTRYTEGDYLALMQHYSAKSNFLDWSEDAMAALYFAFEEYVDEKKEKTDKSAALYLFSPELYNYAVKKMVLKNKNKNKEDDMQKTVVNNLLNTGIIPNLTVDYNREQYSMYLLGKRGYDNKLCTYNKFYCLPLAIYVSRLNRRIQAQNGLFLAYNVYSKPENNDEFDYLSLEQIQEEYLEDFQEETLYPFLYKVVIQKNAREGIYFWLDAFGMSKEKYYPELSNVGERVIR